MEGLTVLIVYDACNQDTTLLFARREDAERYLAEPDAPPGLEIIERQLVVPYGTLFRVPAVSTGTTVKVRIDVTH